MTVAQDKQTFDESRLAGSCAGTFARMSLAARYSFAAEHLQGAVRESA